MWRTYGPCAWFDGPFRHSPYDSNFRSIIEDLADSLSEVMRVTADDWENMFRRRDDHVADMRFWQTVSFFLAHFVGPTTRPAAVRSRPRKERMAACLAQKRRIDALRVVVLCMGSVRPDEDEVWLVCSPQYLSLEDVRTIINGIKPGPQPEA